MSRDEETFERILALIVYCFIFWVLQGLFGLEAMVSIGFGMLLFGLVYNHE